MKNLDFKAQKKPENGCIPAKTGIFKKVYFFEDPEKAENFKKEIKFPPKRPNMISERAQNTAKSLSPEQKNRAYKKVHFFAAR